MNTCKGHYLTNLKQSNVIFLNHKFTYKFRSVFNYDWVVEDYHTIYQSRVLAIHMYIMNKINYTIMNF